MEKKNHEKWKEEISEKTKWQQNTINCKQQNFTKTHIIQSF